MKHFMLLFVLFISQLLAAQSAWLQEGQSWQYRITFMSGGSIESVIRVESDTLVLGKTVKKIKAVTPHPLGWWFTPDRFAYADGSKVWMYSKKLNDFTRLYDFDLNVGDSLAFPASHINNDTLRYRIDSTGAAPFGGQTRRFQIIRIFGTHSWLAQPALVVEGIGMIGNPQEFNLPRCSYFFIDDLLCTSPTDGSDLLFMCFHENNYTYAPFSGLCSLVNVNEPEEAADIRIFPNPATETFQVQILPEQTRARVRVLNVQGQVVHAAVDATLPVSVKTLSSGLYFAEITLQNGRKVIRKVVKE